MATRRLRSLIFSVNMFRIIERFLCRRRMKRYCCSNVGEIRTRLLRKVEQEWFIFRLTMYSLFYNSLSSCTTVIDTIMEPMFWFVDHFVRYLGPVFVVLVVVLTTAVVVIFYVCLLPHKATESFFWVVYHLVFGHWLLVNIVFHYFKAAFTNPGHPTQDVPEVVAICKKCISQKPPRSHHCSICHKCILKMDHHCPWLNNCVGHFNHRYFFLFCAYMWVGCIYVCISAYPLFKMHFYGNQDVGWSGVFYPFYLMKVQLESSFTDQSSPSSSNGSVVMATPRSTNGMWFHHFVMFEFLLCSAATVALGALLLWHVRLIHYAETSIEVHTNRAERKRYRKRGAIFHNPYDFGPLRNWKRFLGLTDPNRSFFWNVLMPSSHPPEGNGLQWKTVYSGASAHEGVLLV